MKIYHGSLIVGIVLMLAPFISVWNDLRHMFATLGSSGMGDPQSLFPAFGEIFASAGFIWLLLPLGAVVSTYSVNRLSRRQIGPPLVSA